MKTQNMDSPSDAARALQALSVAARKRDPKKLAEHMRRVRACTRPGPRRRRGRAGPPTLVE